MREKLIVILGPTAVGKTSLSIDVATHFNGEIISGDSMQVYKGMDIGTAKILPDERKDVPHYLIDCFFPDHHFSVAEFQELATKKISEINNRNHIPIIAGGTGLYIKSVTHKYKFPNAASDGKYREELMKWSELNGIDALHHRLAEIDPKAAKRLHVNDVKRVIRALEVYHATGKTLSQLLDGQETEANYDLVMVGLTMDRAKLYSRINQRVDLMIEQGLVVEVKKLIEQGYDENHVSMQGIGYKEIIKYLKGEISLERAIYLIKQGTRRFAKRQLSWFRQLSDIHWFDMTNDEKKVENIDNIYEIIAGNFPTLQN